MNYIDEVAERIADACGMEVVDPEDMRLLRIYALLALTVGSDVTLEQVHDAWAAWRAQTKPDHRSLVPFNELTPEVQALDEPYRAAISKALLTPVGSSP